MKEILQFVTLAAIPQRNDYNVLHEVGSSCRLCSLLLVLIVEYMESDSQPGSKMGRSPLRLADVMGTLIAIATLALPTIIVTHYSSYSDSRRPTSSLAPPYSVTRTPLR